MFLIQLMAADDIPMKDLHQSPCQGMVLRGANRDMEANIKKRHQAFVEQEKTAAKN